MLALLTFTLTVSAPIMAIGGVLLALDQDVPLSSLLLVIVPVLALVVGLIISRMRPLFRLMQVRLDRINRVLREQISGVRVASGAMQIGALTAFLSYLVQILISVMMATFMFVMVPRAEVCAERIQEVLG